MQTHCRTVRRNVKNQACVSEISFSWCSECVMIRGQVVGRGTREETVIGIQVTEECFSTPCNTMGHPPHANHWSVCAGDSAGPRTDLPLLLRDLAVAVEVKEWSGQTGETLMRQDLQEVIRLWR